VPALLALPEVKEMFGGEPPHDRTDVVVFRGEAETLVMTTLFAEGCAGQEPAIVAVWKMGPGDALELLGTEEGITDALLAADARGDGRLELVVREDLLGTALLRRTGKRGELSRTDRAPVSILGCRC
jgi:hypothetical protein